jgi:hypothetical protein
MNLKPYFLGVAGSLNAKEEVIDTGILPVDIGFPSNQPRKAKPNPTKSNNS